MASSASRSFKNQQFKRMENTTSSVAVVWDSVDEGPSSSSAEGLHHEVEEEEDNGQGRGQSQDQRGVHRLQRYLVYYGRNVSLFPVVSFNMRDEACSAFVVFVAFWIFACMTVILGFYGSSTIQLEPNCSRLVEANSFFVESIQAKEIHESVGGPILYGFTEVPPLDVLNTWLEKHDAVVESGDHKVWPYFLNPGSKIHVSYSVKSPSFSALSLVIAQGGESLSEWIEDPLYPNTTLSWNIIHGNGTIDLEILSSSIYHVALGNLNLQEVKVQLNFTIEALTYNTSQAYYKCSLRRHPCTLKLHLLEVNAAVLTSPGPTVGVTNHKWYVKLNYTQRWISYFTISASITVFILVIIRICKACGAASDYGAGFQAGGAVTERVSLLSAKDDDLSSWGSSYNLTSEGEEEFNDAVAILTGNQLVGESNNDHRCVCILCLDALRDCFFLPCGHCASCFTCGTRVIEEGGACPICHRATRKVRKIFSV